MASPSRAVDTTNWPTLTQAAVLLATNERTIRRWIDAGRLRSDTRAAAGRKPLVIVDPQGVEKLRGERQTSVVVVREDNNLPADSDMRQPARIGPAAVGPHVPPEAAALQHFLAGVIHAFPVRRPWLTLDEASEYSGLPKRWLMEQALLGEKAFVLAIDVGTEKQPRWRFSRRSLAK